MWIVANIIVTAVVVLVVISPLTFLSLGFRWARLVGRVSPDDLIGQTLPLFRPLAIATVYGANVLDERQRRALLVQVWTIRLVAASMLFLVVGVPLLVSR